MKTKRLKTRFREYAAGFYGIDPMLDKMTKLKEDHTLRVCENSNMICSELEVSEETMLLGEAVAVCHDIGRFEQFKKYGTFRDSESEDHAEIGLAVIDETHILDEFSLVEQDIIKTCVHHHNKAFLPGAKSPDSMTYFLMRLIRDADKLDIWLVVSENYKKNNAYKSINGDYSDGPDYSEKVIAALLNESIVKLEDAKNLTDIKLLQLGWVYDLNFAPAYKALKERGYIDLIESVLPDKGRIKEAVCMVRRHMDAWATPEKNDAMNHMGGGIIHFN